VPRDAATRGEKHRTSIVTSTSSICSTTTKTLFSRTIMSDPSRFLPIEYDPTIGEACLKFGHIYRQTRGMYLSITRRRKVKDILKNWPQTDVRFTCITDGGRILGLRDLGANGMGIPIGKLQLYTAAAGVAPHYLLPMYRDADTNNKQYLQEGSKLDAELESGSKNGGEGSRTGNFPRLERGLLWISPRSARGTSVAAERTAGALRTAFLLIGSIALSACDLRGAPSYSIFGAYFPAWLLCSAIGILGSVGLRAAVVASGLEDAIPMRLLVYVGFATAVALWLWLSLFGGQ
jgi:malic enzyme